VAGAAASGAATCVVVMPEAPWRVAESLLEDVERCRRKVEEAEALEVKRGLCHMMVWSNLYRAGFEAEFFNAKFFTMQNGVLKSV